MTFPPEDQGLAGVAERSPRRQPPAFLITVDTEGDASWSRLPEVTTRNAAFLPRFQELCERFELRPTYLVNYEMVQDAEFRRFAASVLARNTGEVGMHLHAWHSPPEHALTPTDHLHHPYLMEYPESVLRAKVARMTELLEQAFQRKILSHRAGRWALNATYARVLAEYGYAVDCSVTPHVSWRRTRGAPGGSGGADYRGFPQRAYFLDLDDISRPGTSTLLEVPMTIAVRRPALGRWLAARLGRTADRRGFAGLVKRLSPPCWLRPWPGTRAADLIWVAQRAIERRDDHVQFMIHSSELMPGGSRNFPNARSIERLYRQLESLFSFGRSRFVGLTLADYRRRVAWGAG